MDNIQRVGQVIYKPNWNGGQWVVKGKEFPLSEFKTFNDKLKIVFKGCIYDAKIKDIAGTDHDMGHSYNWKNVSLFATANIDQLGDVDYNLAVKCSDNKSKVYLEIQDQ